MKINDVTRKIILNLKRKDRFENRSQFHLSKNLHVGKILSKDNRELKFYHIVFSGELTVYEDIEEIVAICLFY